MADNTSSERPTTRSDPTDAGKRPAPPRRRWPRRLAIALVIVLLLVIALVAALPYIASSRAVSNYAVAFVNDQLTGSIRLQKLSLSWGGPIRASGVQVFDADRREVLQVSQITCAAGVWKLLTATEAFGEITIDAPKADLHLTSTNAITLVEALQPRQPSEAAEASERSLPQPRGRLIVRDGAVRITREGGVSYEVPTVNCEIALDTLANLEGKLDIALSDGRRISGQGAVCDLFSDGALDVKTASGTLKIQTDGDVALEPLAAVIAPDTGLAGGAAFDLDATLSGGNWQARFETSARGLQTRQRAAGKAQPLDLKLSGQATVTSEQLTAETKLTGEAGEAEAKISYRRSARPLDVSVDRIVAAALNGQSIELPDFNLEAKAHLDLAALENALPGLLHIRPDQRITAGTLEVSKLAAQGGTQPTASGSIELKDVTAQSGGRAVRLQPIAFGFDAKLEAGTGLKVQQAALKSSFAQLTAQGTPAALQGSFQTDLAKLRQELGSIFDLEALDLAGDLQGNLALTRAGDDRLDVSAEITAKGVQYADQDRRLDLPSVRITHTGAMAFADGKPGRYTTTATKADLNGEVVVAATGWYDAQQDAFHADVDLQRADLGFLASRSKALGVDALARYAGTLSVQAQVDRSAAGQPITTGGNFAARDLTVDGQTLAAGDVRATWKGVRLSADATDLRVELAHFESAPATLNAENIHWQTGEFLVLDGQFNGTADLARCLDAITLIKKLEEKPALTGRLQLNSTCTTTGAVMNLSGQADIDQFEVGVGDKAVRQQRVQFEYAAKVDQQNEKITLGQTRINSAPFSAEVAGTIEQYKTAGVLALSGRYDASWQELTAILHELVPATAKTVIVSGKSTSEFQITGPLRQPDAEPAFRGLAGGLEIGWTSAELYGVSLGAARLSPTLGNGQITLPQAKIPASQGNVILGGLLDLQPLAMTLKMPSRTNLLENVAITRELSTSLLSRINPIFLHLTRVEGKAGLQLKDIVLPLDESIKTTGAGQGQLDLADMKLQPGGLLADLLALGGLTDERMYTVVVSGLSFLIKDGRISYKDFTLTFPNDFDLKFYGSVGFDETLDLSISLPVRPELLARLGAKGPVAEYARVLSGLRIDIPLVGTREKPKLDLARVDVKSLVERALKELSGEKLDGLLRGAIRDQGKEQDKQTPKTRRR
ncbi:MAG TPA: hypothetical protein VMZ31_18695 [Phycisphaerae bacterium]|nr:hypothetical protein [Phycisphaerae bacterium]